ncbi:hypothetical protein VKT23_014358 [Stygiomarasmius scandens]|uniref:Uncharacterized protein n=1 Tax=Marasmiellus scandens TaxID=2682957 RepID=A0ABR1J549_9AGAR
MPQSTNVSFFENASNIRGSININVVNGNHTQVVAQNNSHVFSSHRTENLYNGSDDYDAPLHQGRGYYPPPRYSDHRASMRVDNGGHGMAYIEDGDSDSGGEDMTLSDRGDESEDEYIHNLVHHGRRGPQADTNHRNPSSTSDRNPFRNPELFAGHTTHPHRAGGQRGPFNPGHGSFSRDPGPSNRNPFVSTVSRAGSSRTVGNNGGHTTYAYHVEDGNYNGYAEGSYSAADNRRRVNVNFVEGNMSYTYNDNHRVYDSVNNVRTDVYVDEYRGTRNGNGSVGSGPRM